MICGSNFEEWNSRNPARFPDTAEHHGVLCVQWCGALAGHEDVAQAATAPEALMAIARTPTPPVTGAGRRQCGRHTDAAVAHLPCALPAAGQPSGPDTHLCCCTRPRSPLPMAFMYLGMCCRTAGEHRSLLGFCRLCSSLAEGGSSTMIGHRRRTSGLSDKSQPVPCAARAG